MYLEEFMLSIWNAHKTVTSNNQQEQLKILILEKNKKMLNMSLKCIANNKT